MDYHIVLGAAVGVKRDWKKRSDGMEAPIAACLGVPRRKNSQGRRAGKLTPFQRAMHAREKLSDHMKAFPIDSNGNSKEPWKVGEAVLSLRGQRGVIHSLHDDGSCEVLFNVGECEAIIHYASTGKGKGGARLHRPLPSLRPAGREQRKDATSKEARERVVRFCHKHLAESPYQRDAMRRRISPHVFEKAQALIVMSTLKNLHVAYLKEHPEDEGTIHLANFKSLLPWYLKFAQRAVCCCKHCENFACYLEALHQVPPLLTVFQADDIEGGNHDLGSASCNASATNGNDSSENEPDAEHAGPAEQPLAQLIRVCALTSKREFVNEFICGKSIEDAASKCYHGKCAECGFKKVWSKGIRPELVGPDNKPKMGIDPLWLTVVKWWRYKSAKPGGGQGIGDGVEAAQGSKEKELLRQRCEGTLIDLLDEFEDQVMRKYPFHRHTLSNQKRADTDRHQNVWPHWLQLSSDWSENGPIWSAREIQSEYWNLKTFSLFICIARFLLNSAWINRESKLPIGTEVSVEPEGQSIPIYSRKLGALLGHLPCHNTRGLDHKWWGLLSRSTFFNWCST